MDKFIDVNLIDYLNAIMDINTLYHKKDFDIDIDTMRKTARSNDPSEKTWLWLSRPGGTEFYLERQAFLQGTSAHNGWRFYREMTNDSVLAYAVEIKDINKNTGIVNGSIYELDYPAHVTHLRTASLPSTDVTITYKDGQTKRINREDFKSDRIDMTKVKFYRNEPDDPVALENFLRQEKENRERACVLGDFAAHLKGLKEKRITFEAEMISLKLQVLGQPNSPNGTHYMTEVSDHFSSLSNSSDFERLLKLLPYKSVNLSVVKDRHGLFAFVNEKEMDKIRKKALNDKKEVGDGMRYTSEQYEKAKNVNLVSFLQERGYELKKDGLNSYKLKQETGFTISNNLWCWHSQGGIGGNAIDFLVKYEKMPLVEAVLYLSGDAHVAAPPKDFNKQLKTFTLPEKNDNNKRVIAYLNKTRGIDSEIIFAMINKGAIFESNKFNNCVFVGADKSGVIRYATMRGTSSNAEKAFRQDVENSDKSYGFTIKGASNKVFIFESPIDALSHASLYKMQGLDWKQDSRVSLGCVSGKALERFLEDNQSIDTIEFCLDNDTAGLKAAKELGELYTEKGYTVYVSPPNYKDYNEELVAVISGHEQIGEQSSKADEMCM